VSKIKALTDALRASMSGAERERKMAEVAQVDKERAQGDWDVRFLWGGRIITALFIWAGETELADRIAPSVARPGRTEQIAREEREDDGESEGSEGTDEGDAPSGGDSEGPDTSPGSSA
jgi:hypothetical protein